MSALDPSVLLNTDAATDVVNQADLSPASQQQSIESDELTTSSPIAASPKDESSEIVVDEKPLDLASQDEWPSIASSTTEHQSAVEALEDADPTEEQWPSITTLTDDVGDEVPAAIEQGVSADLSIDAAAPSSESSSNENVFESETLLPSIDSAEVTDDVRVEEVVVKVDESEWPSISTDATQEMLAPFVPSDNPESSIQNDENFSHITDVDLLLPLNNPLDQPDLSEQLTVEDQPLGTLPTETTSDHVSRSVIPDLDLTYETVENYDELDSKPSVSEDANTTDVLQELGELRFAEDD